MSKGMDKNKDENHDKKELQIRSSAAEYLTFIAANGDDQEAIEIRYEDENIWLTQKMMAALYDVSVATINEHLKKIYADSELQEKATIRNFLIVQKEGSRNVSREVKHYNLQAIIAVGFKVNNERAVQFRKWANQIVKDFTIKGWAMDDERLKNSGTKLTKDYFEKLLVKIREIRLSERRFYQKITDIYATSLDYDPSAKATKRFFAAIQNKLHYATSLDYDPSAKATKRFFAAIQNKLHYAIHGKTAAELIVDRANHKTKNMGLTTWEGSPDSKIHKYDVVVAKNYLNEEELNQMQRIVSSYLDMAELQAERHIPMTMEDWEKRLNGFLELWDKEILKDAGKVSAALAKEHAESEFEKYRITQDRLYKSDFDKFLELEENTKEIE